MCGVFALIGYTPDLNYFKSGAKRGPEHSSLERVDDIYLGFHRLAINGLTSAGNQPFHYNNYILVCNGEIYNYKELIAKYNLVLTTGSDCEVIVHLYHLIGNKCLDELDGEFAFIIYNKINKSLFVARDPYGVRPLYMSYTNNSFCFCSDIEPMKCATLSNLKQFTPGTYMILVKNNNYYINESVYYPKFKGILNTTISQHMYNIYDLLCKAVIKRVNNTERPVACLLSGGLDSSLVAAIAARHYLEKGLTLETYSIGLNGSEDLKYAAIVAKHINSKHTEIICSEEDFINSIPQVIKDIESYDTTSVRASVGNWNVGKYIKENSNAKVVLNGDGADELMGGYMYFHKCPSSTEFDIECKRLLKNIHYFDVLRSDKCISSHGLEPRTPYLDFDFVSYYLRIPPNIRNHVGKCEKYLIREAFNLIAPSLLPKEILFRKKEAFSDGVSSLNNSWYQIIQARVEHLIIPDELYIFNPPITKEQKYYRHLFETNYKGCGNIIPYFWMPKYVNATDASARTLNIYHEI
uniref:asparagine synthase (glutamine-hydrolyzing) n=1 Tax=viral metagenome TaxID=1070528 RepID=A0A6C0EUI3_9ZZZZ